MKDLDKQVTKLLETIKRLRVSTRDLLKTTSNLK